MHRKLISSHLCANLMQANCASKAGLLNLEPSADFKEWPQ